MTLLWLLFFARENQGEIHHYTIVSELQWQGSCIRSIIFGSKQ